MTEVTSIHAPKIMKRFMNAEALRYLFIGVCTTLVNLIVFTVLCKLVHMDVNLANFISIVTAILFAYVTNKLYVFRSHCASVGELASECVKFCGARVATMAIEMGGVFLIYNILGFDELIAKCCTQVFVVIGNYFISKFFVFRGNQKKSDSPENVQITDGGSADCTSQERAQEL